MIFVLFSYISYTCCIAIVCVLFSEDQMEDNSLTMESTKLFVKFCYNDLGDVGYDECEELLHFFPTNIQSTQSGHVN